MNIPDLFNKLPISEIRGTPLHKGRRLRVKFSKFGTKYYVFS
jgi:hypothetical protein